MNARKTVIDGGMGMKYGPVALVKCKGYDRQEVDSAVSRAVEMLGGIDRYIKPGMKVLLKCNLLARRRPEEAVTVHPAVVEAVVRVVQSIGATPVIADSPGGLYTERILRGIYRACGMEEVHERTGVILNYNTDTVEVSHPEGKVAKRMTVIKVLQDVDAVISVAKLKTHELTLFTGAVKNLFGVIPGMTKAEYHLRMKRLEDFSDLLIDICTYVKPVLSVMDGIEGMEGNGPSAGSPRHVGALLVSPSPYALDVVSAALVGLPVERICTVQRAEERGLCSSKLEDIELVGDPFDDLYISDFKLPDSKKLGFLVRALESNNRVSEFLKFYLGPHPVIRYDACAGCGDCARYCPPKAIKIIDKKPHIDLNACIRCYCCQELCPHKAVAIRRNWFFRIFK
ncbi:uncharacterized protein (DUF362 family)/Pyruvate/2-oxoacid:ferredoxin oxidoreductase delta subunit [Caldicoprobacter guelmensis]|uniref:DUF362 domain-containing protein n=1 Tax=Caldicoprobacter guelmensis TaxID=1170224 RepID=UPI00311CB1A1|nr:uncharacterized protein (DUF362 family)/Pyruvate/2-oxoacid:ferredoxin oxidoreductase delta subunit [Caldicoprobacter guelmensis]